MEASGAVGCSGEGQVPRCATPPRCEPVDRTLGGSGARALQGERPRGQCRRATGPADQGGAGKSTGAMARGSCSHCFDTVSSGIGKRTWREWWRSFLRARAGDGVAVHRGRRVGWRGSRAPEGAQIDRRPTAFHANRVCGQRLNARLSSKKSQAQSLREICSRWSARLTLSSDNTGKRWCSPRFRGSLAQRSLRTAEVMLRCTIRICLTWKNSYLNTVVIGADRGSHRSAAPANGAQHGQGRAKGCQGQGAA